MKKTPIILLIVFCGSWRIHSQERKYSNWSITLESGIYSLDGDIAEESRAIIPYLVRGVSYGGNLEYSLTPVFSLSLDYNYLPLSGSISEPNSTISTNIHSPSINAHVNILKLIYPQLNPLLTLYANAGWGISYYDYNPIDNTTNLPFSNTRLYNGKSTSYCKTIPFSIGADYNLNKQINLGLKIHYNSFRKDDLEGLSSLASSSKNDFMRGASNDFTTGISVYLKYKISTGKQKKHLHNLGLQEYLPNGKYISNRRFLRNQIDTLKLRVTNLEQEVIRRKKEDSQLHERIDSLKMFGVLMKQIENSEKKDSESTNSQSKDNQARDIIWRRIDSLDVRLCQLENRPLHQDATPVNVFNKKLTVYFKFNDTQVEELSMNTINTVAESLNMDPELKVFLLGYTDKYGSFQYNQILSQKRSNAIKDILMRKYKIKKDRISSEGKGILSSGAPKDARRCDIIFYK